MVKLSPFIIIFIFIGCNQHNNPILIQNNDLLVYFNYHELIPFDLHYDNCQTIKDFSLDVLELSTKTPITGNDSIITIEIINDFTLRYYKNSEYISLNDSISNIELFFCGKISIVDRINSYLVLLEEPGNFWDPDETISSILYLLNCKDKRLTSLVKLSSYIFGLNESIKKTYLMDHMPNDLYFSQIHDFFEGMPFDWYIHKQYIEKYAKDIKVKYEEDMQNIIYSLFFIDEEGFIQTIDIL